MAYYNEDGSIDFSMPDDRPTGQQVAFERLQAAQSKIDTMLEQKSEGKNFSNKIINQAFKEVAEANRVWELQSLFDIDNSVATTNNTGSNSGYDSPGGFYAGPPAEPMTPAAIPTALAPAVIPPPPPPVKTAPIDTVLFDDESLPIEIMTDLIFENIGGHELINVARNDIVNGQQVSYQPIKNLSSIQQQYNPNNILSLQSTSDKYFANFSIKLENKIPDPGTGPNGKHVYLDDDTGNMIIEAINLESDEQIQVEITTSGTIYEAEFGEVTS